MKPDRYHLFQVVEFYFLSKAINNIFLGRQYGPQRLTNF